MPRTLKLLLTENVDNTGIVGDVVTVRKGYARNFLLPRGLATTPSDEKIKELAGKRADAERMLAELRHQREELTKKLEGFELSMIRSCNDQGILYAAVTQHEIAEALGKEGFPGIKDREVRLAQTIKRVDTYEIHVKFETDLEAAIKLWVMPDRKLELKKDEPVVGAVSAHAQPAAGEENLTPAEKRQKDKSAKFDTAKPGTKEEKPADAAKHKPGKDAAAKEGKADAHAAKPKKGSDEAKRSARK